MHVVVPQNMQPITYTNEKTLVFKRKRFQPCFLAPQGYPLPTLLTSRITVGPSHMTQGQDDMCPGQRPQICGEADTSIKVPHFCLSFFLSF